MIRHHFTVDVEEFFHSSLLVDRIGAGQWDAFPRRAPALLPWLIDKLDEAGARATFFVLGWMAEREPELIRDLAARGHEVAAHGQDHVLVPAQTPVAFRASVRRCKALLEDLTGREVVGFRAPSFSILPGCEWALDVLVEEGYRYDSSLFPIGVHPTYGYPDAPPDPHWIERPTGRILEVPPATLTVAGRRFPAAGGAYARWFPYALTAAAFREAERRGSPATFYIHPWDLDPRRPDLRLPPLLRLRLFAGAGQARARVARLLSDFRFAPVAERLSPPVRAGG